MTTTRPEPPLPADRPKYLRAALLPYYHLPHRSLWRSALNRLHALGFNAVFVPFPWSYHSPALGFHDFTGPRDITALLDEIAHAGLWLIPHIGPWLSPALPDGIPRWCSAYQTLRNTPSKDQRLQSYRDAIASWWDALLPHLQCQPNLSLCALNPGLPAETPEAAHLAQELLDLAHDRGLKGPYILPYAIYTALNDLPDTHSILPYLLHQVEEIQPPPPKTAMAWIELTDRLHKAEETTSPVLTDKLTSTLVRFSVVVISRLHTISPWGCLYSGAPTSPSDNLLAPPCELTACSDICRAVKRALFQAETLQGMTRADNLRLREEPRSTDRLNDSPAAPNEINVPLGVPGLPDTRNTTSPLGMPWALRYGRVLRSTMRPLLRLTIARRELLVVENAGHGTLILEGILSLRHKRGNVQIDARESTTISVSFSETPLETVIFDVPDGNLQILSVSPDLAARLWPLDDLWRTDPCYPSHWTAVPDLPTRSLILGPETAVPSGDMAFTAVVQGKGYGYRWGPWRGNDPLTWLAPFYWDAPTPFTLPALTWEQRAGAPEALPDYDDEMWQTVSLPLTLDLGSELARSCGLFWLRASFDGRPGSLTLTLPTDGDLFLNGVLIASLTVPLQDGASGGGSWTIPLPARHLRERNVLAILADAGWLMQPHIPLTQRSSYGHSLSCQFEGARNVTWKKRWGILGQVVRQGFADFADWRLVEGEGSEAITWHRSLVHLDLPHEIEAPIFLTLESPPRRALVYLNGVLLRRLDQRQAATERIWLPDGLLKRAGHNEILIAQWTRGARPGIQNARLEAGPTAHVISRKLARR